ncbi:MAG TPA: hypothetical protein VFU88_16955 [Ktedonobacterales bacterium]|nr:hypothetical protein [Ktedonobacterales bacterium]
MRHPSRLASAPSCVRGSRLSPHAIISAILLALALLLSACSSSATTGATAGATGSPTAAEQPADTTPTALPSPNPSITDCSQASGFGSAGPASAGANFTDVAFPSDSVSTTASPFAQVYTFQVINVCTNNASTSSVHGFFTSSLPSNGWSKSATYPYKGNVSSSCGDPYCWRKQSGSNIRYVSLENISVGGAVAVYALRLATAPIPTFSVVTHYTNHSAPQGQTTTVTATCGKGEQMVGGGYFIDDTNKIYEPGESYPSSSSAWTSAIYNNTSEAMTLYTYAECAQANFPLNVQHVKKSLALSAGGIGPVWAACPSATVAVGGGFQASDAGGNVGWTVGSSPGVDFTKNAWTVNTQAKFGALTETAWVLCASANAVASRISTAGAGTVGASSGAQQTPGCNGDEYATSGGFTYVQAGSEGNLFYYGSAPAKNPSQWIVDVYNRDSSASHQFNATTFCIAPKPKF